MNILPRLVSHFLQIFHIFLFFSALTHYLNVKFQNKNILLITFYFSRHCVNNFFSFLVAKVHRILFLWFFLYIYRRFCHFSFILTSFTAIHFIFAPFFPKKSIKIGWMILFAMPFYTHKECTRILFSYHETSFFSFTPWK